MDKPAESTRLSRPNPKDFLRARRPEEFSDSVKLQESAIDRSMLEYHFASLNNRSQELQFEVFVRKLCEREVCPNLIPQTGPTAGGDGKTDTETYPVSNQIAFFWGLNDAPEAERWAFGVSTQKAWKAKCVKDVESMLSTGRGYSKIFCVSSMYIKNSSRVALQDKLSKEHGVEVTIFDRSWLLDKTLHPKNQQLAIDYLGLTGSIESQIQIGPFDADKRIQLAEIERKIDQIEDPGNLTFSQVDLYTKRAIIHKELEQDAYAVRHHFDVAVRTAKKFGSKRQRFDALYQYAWAAYWWLEDIDLFESYFEQAIAVAEQTENVEVWEKVVTLYNLVITSHRHGTSTLDNPALEGRIRLKLDSLANDPDMISSSLQAQTALGFLDLLSCQTEDQVNAVFGRLETIAGDAHKLIGYPIARLLNLVEALDVAFGDLDTYNSLLNKLIDDAGAREGGLVVADRYLRRAAVSFDKKDYNRAIKHLGMSLYGLYTPETKDEMFSALYMLSHAYEKKGLSWAARGAAIMAAHLVTSQAIKGQRGSRRQVAIYNRLLWIEAQQGRLSQSLHWYSLSRLVGSTLDDDPWTDDQRISYECLLGQLLLNASFSEVQQLAWLPDKLRSMGLHIVADALWVCLGYESKLSEDDVPFNIEFINTWRGMDFGVPVAPLDLYMERWTTVNSQILGCAVSVSFPIKSPCIEVAQQLLAVIESFCAPMMAERAVASVPSMTIDISLEHSASTVIEYSFDMGAQIASAHITCSAFDSTQMTASELESVQTFFTEFCLHFVSAIRPHIGFSKLEEMLRDDKALERAVTFNSNLGLQTHMMGKDVDPSIESHKDASYELYLPTRSVSWADHYDVPKSAEVETNKAPTDEQEVWHPYKLDDLKHSDVKVHSLIQNHLWDQAGWRGVGFGLGERKLPLMMFAFEQVMVGQKIFSNMAGSIGKEDSAGSLRITLIRGIDKANPAHYRVVVSQNVDYSKADSSKLQTLLSRINTMTPNSSENLERFLHEYGLAKKCCVATPSADGRPVTHIITTGVVTKWAWEIDANDPDISAIGLEDDVYIPEGEIDPPIRRAHAQIGSFRRR
ncbi:hypothetical protein ALQ34_01958 [Pseudomonas syringae pv. maculicola]|uniref:hypothetical protein n=1 Tax=Pseudomonas syringae group genomosp. 3 TaxID=251701 RepID=UPI000EFF03D1|nr:hypothetical protein [Pseudomonas syringae group genomosp. 3]RMO81252.1 hypothetical protein ALQ34_01958 [Pseudomonas syringae pv. maculicola]